MNGEKIYDFAVAGAGIVGLATAYYLRRIYPQASILILEKEADVAYHQTGRNSGVIHSGIYYKPGSHKAQNCIQGYGLLLDFLKQHNIPHRIGGKLIVATEAGEIPRLQELYRNGLANGLDRIRYIEGEEIRKYEPHIRGLAAIHVPYTGVTDFGLVSRTLKNLLAEQGVHFRFGTRVDRIEPGEPVQIHADGQLFSAKKMVVTAGLHGDRLYGGHEFRIVPFRGEYYNLNSEQADKIRSMVYPVPDPRYPFLGIHLTRHIDGRVSAGPSAVLAFGREAYRKGQWNLRDMAYILGFPGFWRMAARHWRTGVHEMMRSAFKSRFARAAQKFLPHLQAGDLTGFHSGIRAQLVDRQGNLADDFVIRQRQNTVYVLNAPSPAATASLSIGRQVAALC